MTKEQKDYLLKIANPNQDPRVDVYIPVYAGGEIIYDGFKRLYKNQQSRLQYLNIKGKSVLDMGCNTGFISNYCALNGATSVVAVDLKQNLINVCNYIKEIDNISNIDFICGLKEDLEKDYSQKYNFPFDIGLNLSNHNIEITVRNLKKYGHLAKVWYLEPTNHEAHFLSKEETKKQGIEAFSQFGDVEFLTYTDYQDRGLFKLVTK